MAVAVRLAERIARSHRYLRPLLMRGRAEEVLSQSGVPRHGSRALTIDGTDFIDFATTSYLGLDSDPAVIRACTSSLQAVGFHRYISRAFFSVREYQLLESRLARILDLPDAIVFPSATSLHQTLLPLLADRGTLVVADEQVHHSMHEALRACDDADIRWIPHGDLAATAAALKDRSPGTEAIILADGVYSLSGKIAPIEKLYHLAAEHDALLYLDDSHGFGIFGERGEGVPHRLRGDRTHLLYVGSLSKALGCYGAFIGTTKALGETIRDFAGGLLFSGPLPTVLLAGAVAATDVLLSPRLAHVQRRLWENQKRVIAALREGGLHPLSEESPIVCVDFVDINRIESVVRTMRDHCILASVVAFPAVPRGHYRIRFSVSANHTDQDIDRLAEAILACQVRAPLHCESPMPTKH